MGRAPAVFGRFLKPGGAAAGPTALALPTIPLVRENWLISTQTRADAASSSNSATTRAGASRDLLRRGDKAKAYRTDRSRRGRVAVGDSAHACGILGETSRGVVVAHRPEEHRASLCNPLRGRA